MVLSIRKFSLWRKAVKIIGFQIGNFHTNKTTRCVGRGHWFLFIIHVQSWNAYIVCLTEILNYISLDNPCRTRVCQFTVTAVIPGKLQSSHGNCGHPMETAVVLWKLWSAHGILQVELIAQRKWYIFLYCEIPTNGLFVYHPNRCILFPGYLFTNSDLLNPSMDK